MKTKIKKFFLKYLRSEMFIINLLCFIGAGTTATLLFYQQLKNIYLIDTKNAILLIIIIAIVWFSEQQHKEKKKEKIESEII